MSRPSHSEARHYHQRIDNGLDALRSAGEGGPSYQTYDPHEEGEFKADHPRYPDYQYPDDREADTLWAAKGELAQGFGARYNLNLGDKDAQYLLKKKEAQEMVQFKQFVEDSIPRGTPWAKDFFEKIIPGWYQSKVDVINQKMDIMQRFIDITVRGPQSIDDMYLLYQAYTGRIVLPTTFADMIRPDGVGHQGIDRGTFTSGLFSPKRYVKSSFAVSSRNQKFMSNFAIPGIDIKGLAAAGQTMAVTNDNHVWGAADNIGLAGPLLTRAAQPGYPGVSADGAFATRGYFGRSPFVQTDSDGVPNPDFSRHRQAFINDAIRRWDADYTAAVDPGRGGTNSGVANQPAWNVLTPDEKRAQANVRLPRGNFTGGGVPPPIVYGPDTRGAKAIASASRF